MRRGKRKRSSRAANPSESPIDVTTPAKSSEGSSEESLGSPINVAIDEERFAGSPGVPDDAEDLTSFVNMLSDAEQITDSLNASTAAEIPAAHSIAATGADRRTHPRYEFSAAAEVLPAESGARMETRVRDLSQQGCYIDTSDALPLGTVTDVRITKGAQLFEARARVVYSRAAKGMGLVFTTIEPERVRTLETWLTESRETSWLAANRRRSQRVLMAIPVRVSGKTGASVFEEDARTRAISAHGALILLSAQVFRGQRLTLSNVQTKASLECVVAHIDRRQKNQPQVGVEFMLPNPMFWHVAFPPKDWTPRHPDAKSRAKARESS